MPDFDDSLGGQTLGDADNENRFDKSLGDQHTLGDANIEEDLLDDGIKLEDLSDRYTEERVLGHGGSGQVALLTDIRYPLQPAIEERADIVYGSQFKIKEKTDPPAWQILPSMFLSPGFAAV